MLPKDTLPGIDSSCFLQKTNMPLWQGLHKRCRGKHRKSTGELQPPILTNFKLQSVSFRYHNLTLSIILSMRLIDMTALHTDLRSVTFKLACDFYFQA